MNKLFKTYYIRDIGKVSMCKRVLKEETFDHEEIPFYKISTFGGNADTFISRKHYLDYRQKYSFPKIGEILISAAGTIGRTVTYNGEEGYFQDSNIVWVENDETKVRNDYLYYFFQTKPWFTTHGSTISRIYNENLRSIKLTVPEGLIDQQKIAKVLSTLDSKIELNNRINAELEAMAKTLYDYWFVQFDFPDGNGKPYKSSGGKLVWNEELKREIPEKWAAGTLSDLGEIIGGSTPLRENAENFDPKGISWITPKDLSENTGNKFITKGEVSVSDVGLKSASLKLLPKGSILMSSRAPVGYMAIAREPVTTNQGFKSFVPKEGYSSSFIYYTIKNAMPEIINNASGSTFKEISGSTLKTIKVCLSISKVIENYSSIVDVIFVRQNNLELENQKLTELRDWLLPMLMNGQVKVN